MTTKLPSDHEIINSEGNGGWWAVLAYLYYILINLVITLGAVGLLLVAHWLFNWANCPDCCCNSCNRGSSYCAFPRFNGEDIGDETRNFIFWMGLTGILNFMLSYSLWANYGSPRMFLLIPSLVSLCLLAQFGLNMKWLMCRPVAKPTNNLSNWISMETLDTEHGRVAIYSIAAYASIIMWDFCVSFTCCCCIEEVEEDDSAGAKVKVE